MNKSMTNREIARDAVAFLLALGIPVLATVLGAWMFMVDIMFLVPFVWLGLRRGKVASAITVLLSAGLVFLLSHSAVLALEKGVLGLGVSLLFVIGIERHWRNGKILFWSALSGVFYILVDVFSLGLHPIAVLDKSLTGSFFNETLTSYRQAGVLQLLQNQGFSEAQVKSSLLQGFQILARLYPSLQFINVILIVSLSFLLVRAVVNKAAISHLSLTPFRQWSLPWYAVWGAIAGLAGYLGGDYLQVSWLVTAGMNTLVVYFLICLILGIAVITHFFVSPKIPLMLKIMFILVTILNLILTSIIVAVFGLFDLVLNFRRIPESL